MEVQLLELSADEVYVSPNDVEVDCVLEEGSSLNSNVDTHDKEHVKRWGYKLKSETVATIRGSLQIPPEGHFDQTDLTWENVTNQGQGKYRNSCRATIPWDRLWDFVEGESSNRDFPCTFREVPSRRVHKPGNATRPRTASAIQKIRFRCEYGPDDKSQTINHDIEKIFSGHLKAKKSTNQKLAAKRVAKKVATEEKEAAKVASKIAKELEKVAKVTTNDVIGDCELSPPPIVPPPPVPTIPKQRANLIQAGKSIKRGCQCEFDAKQLYLDDSLCIIQFHCFDHVNKDGKICHGSSFAGYCHSFGGRLSSRTKAWIRTTLGLGLTPSQVMAKHKREVLGAAARGDPFSRDTFIMPHDVYNIANKRVQQLWQLHPSDPHSVRLWVQNNKDSVFHYQEFGVIDANFVPKGDDEAPFCVAIQTPWQREIMVEYGHNKALSMDSTFGTNESRYPLYTILVFDEWENGIPVAFIVVGKSREKDILPWLEKLNARCCEVRTDWRPKCMIVDNAQAEINAIMKVWPEIHVLLCLWHVRKAWAENAVKKIKDETLRVKVLEVVASIMYSRDLVQGLAAVELALEKIGSLAIQFPDAEDFIDYFLDQWAKKRHMWITANRNFPHCGQDTNAAVESYHGNLKVILTSMRGRLVGRRMDWLIYHLVGDVITHYWYAVQCKQYGFIKNRKAEGIVASAVLRARDIPDSYVLIRPDGCDIALVVSISNFPHVWTVTAPISAWAQCDCPQGMRGYICKHVVKAVKLITPEVDDASIIKYGGTLYGTKTSYHDVTTTGDFAPLSDADNFGGDENKQDQVLLMRATQGVKVVDEEDARQKAMTVMGEIEELLNTNTTISVVALGLLNMVKTKLIDRVAEGKARILHPSSQPRFDIGESTNNIRRNRSFLEERSKTRGKRRRDDR